MYWEVSSGPLDAACRAVVPIFVEDHFNLESIHIDLTALGEDVVVLGLDVRNAAVVGSAGVDRGDEGEVGGIADVDDINGPAGPATQDEIVLERDCEVGSKCPGQLVEKDGRPRFVVENRPNVEG